MSMPEEVLLKYRKYLTDLEYPFIKGIANYEVNNIFESECREMFLSWIMQKFIPAYSNKLEESKKNNKLKEMLANSIYENGFCRLSEKDTFVKGNLDVNKQIVIFDRIFHMLSLKYKKNFLTDNCKENMSETENNLKQIFMKPSKENFKANILQDFTLIPTLSLSNKLSENEKTDKMKFYREEITKLQYNLEQMQSNDGKPCTIENNIDTSSIIEKMEKLTSKFTETSNRFNVDDLITVTENKKERTSIYPKMEDCVEKTAQISKILIKTIQKRCDFNEVMNEKVFEQDDDLSRNDYYACVLQSYAMSDNILQKINRNAED